MPNPGGGTPSPIYPMFHREVFAPQAVSSGVPITKDIAIAGCELARVRWSSAVAGTIVYRFLRPMVAGAENPPIEYGSDNPADSAVVAVTEDSADLTFRGESTLRITFTPSASGNLSFIDIMGLKPS